MEFELQLFATTSRNSYVMSMYDETLAGIPTGGSAYPINQGDLVVWDATLNSGAGGLRNPANQADMAHYIGVAAQQTPVASLGDVLLQMAIWRSCVVKFHGTSGETYYQFQEVYWNETVDVQTITNNTNSNARTVPVGWVNLGARYTMSGTYSIPATTSTTDISVWLNPKFPVSYLV